MGHLVGLAVLAGGGQQLVQGGGPERQDELLRRCLHDHPGGG